MSLKVLMGRYGLSKATAHRAKKRGYFVKDHQNNPSKRRECVDPESLPPAEHLASGAEILLSNEERRLSTNALAARYNVAKAAASEARRTGVLRRSSYGELRQFEGPDKWTSATPSNYDPESRNFRVNLAPAELSYSVERLTKLYASFGLSNSQALAARRFGYFCPNATRPREIAIDEEVFALLAMECMESAEKGARSALRTILGEGWRKKLRGVTLEDVSSAALDRLRELSGREEIAVEKWRFVVARCASLRFIGDRLDEQKKEATTVDNLEGRFEDD